MTFHCKMLLLSATLIALPVSANATTFNFDMSFDGTNVSLNAGSDNPTGTVLNVGDSFNLGFATAGSGYWHVNSPYSVFVPLSFLTTGAADRTVDISTFFLRGNLVVKTIIDSSISQSSIHSGAQNWSLGSGFDFDRIVLTWTLLNISPNGPSTIQAGSSGFFEGFGQADAPFYKSPKITFVGVSTVPLPAALPLLMTGIGAFGLVSRRRKRKAA